jgi:hypothetical protein
MIREPDLVLIADRGHLFGPQGRRCIIHGRVRLFLLFGCFFFLASPREIDHGLNDPGRHGP